MLNNSGPVAKLYLSIMDDVIDGMKELFLDEGLEDRVLDDLRHLWESKVLQSRAMEDFRKNINSSNFVLQLPASYSQNKTKTLATFSLPAALPYPIKIPAGVTLQTASGQLYKVNVPVVVTHAPAGQRAASRLSQTVPEQSEAAAPPNPIPLHEPESCSAPDSFVTQSRTGLTPSQESGLPREPPGREVTLGGSDSSAQPEPGSPCSQLLDIQISAEEAALAQRTQKLSDIVQLDGPADGSDPEEEGEAPMEESDFLGLINAEDPLNSGDDVVEQDIPDLFDTDNVIVCQYDKIHRSKNRWKFHLKDGVMSYGGRDYVFSKAVGEAEW
uniref:General transcription factor IIA, 1-like n=1 Tax=Poecilia reticulata TaxID=8081 RepID=A0A3P9QJV5_POERE